MLRIFRICKNFYTLIRFNFSQKRIRSVESGVYGDLSLKLKTTIHAEVGGIQTKNNQYTECRK